MKQTIEELIQDRILYIGNEIPQSLCEDKRDKFVLLGIPAIFIEEIMVLLNINNKLEVKKEQ